MSNTHRRCNPGSHPSRLSHAIQGILLASALTASVAAHAEESNGNTSRKSYHVSGGALGHALSQFAHDAGILFTGESTLTDGKTSKGLDGEYTVEEGFRKLLAGTGLTYTITDDNAVAIKVAETGSDAASTLPAVKVSGKAVYDPYDSYNSDYNHPSASTATKTNNPIITEPLSIQVVPRAVIQDQKANVVKDALENVSGVRPSTTLGYGTGFTIRGFRNNRVFRNGLVANGIAIAGATELDTANIQNIEVLKGPAAMLFGRIEPGGIININTKRPEKESKYALEQRFGSYDFYRTEWDATGPLNEDKSLRYRFTGSYQNNNSFRDFNFNDRYSFNSSLTWAPSDATEMTLDVEGMEQEFQVDRGLFAIGDKPAPIPISRSFIDPNDPVDSLSNVNVGFNLKHSFNQDWILNHRFLAVHNQSSDISVKPANFFTVEQFLDPKLGNRIYPRTIFAQTMKGQTYTSNIDLTGNFNLFGAKHQTLVGFDFLRSTGTYLTFGNFMEPMPGLEIDIYNPVYGIDSSYYKQALNTPFWPGENHGSFRDEWYGAYFQDHITLWDSFHLIGGGRYDWSTTGVGWDSSFSAAEDKMTARKDEGFSPRVGILYQPVSWASIYGNWTTSFGANNGITSSGQSISPEVGEQFEAGIKTEFFDRRLTTTLAFYHLTKENIMTKDINSDNPFAQIAIGEARSQGVELDVAGQVTENTSLIGNYAFTDARIIKDNYGNQDHRMNNVPEHSGSLWLKYDLQSFEMLKGWNLGIGVFAVGSRQGDDENTFTLPGYARLDAFAAYRHDFKDARVIAQFNIRNLLDKNYYDSTDPFQNAPPRVGIYPGSPLSSIGSIRLEF